MKYKLDLDWHEEEYVYLRFGVDVSDGVMVEVPDELVARREAAWKELAECDRQLRVLYQQQLQAEQAIQDAKDEAEWKAGAPARKAIEEAKRLETQKWEELKQAFKERISRMEAMLGLNDETTSMLLMELPTQKERSLMLNLIGNAKKINKNRAIHAFTPEAIAKREERQKKRAAALQESTT